MRRKLTYLAAALLSAATLFASSLLAQKNVAQLREQKDKPVEKVVNDNSNPGSSEKKDLSEQKYRLLQSNGMLVETAYHQEKNELQHSVSFARSNERNWSLNFTEEIPLGSDKHQFSFSAPAQFVKSGDLGRGFGDVKFEYSYFLIGNNVSKVTVSPGFGFSVPTGNSQKDLGHGSASFSIKVPIGVMLTKRLQSNSTFETSFTPRAKNSTGEKADIAGFEVGQSFVWFAKPKLNLLVETTWEKSQRVAGINLKEYEEEFFVSPGVRWAHTLKKGLTIIPGVAVPFGVGVSSGERGVLFYIAFEHSIKKERE